MIVKEKYTFKLFLSLIYDNSLYKLIILVYLFLKSLKMNLLKSSFSNNISLPLYFFNLLKIRSNKNSDLGFMISITFLVNKFSPLQFYQALLFYILFFFHIAIFRSRHRFPCANFFFCVFL